MNLNNDFKEFIELLNVNEVRYLVIGGDAVSFHGHPRYTKDIDIWIDIITSLLGVSFAECFENRVTASIGDTNVVSIGREALIVNKRATARPQDLADVDHLSED